MRKQTHSLGTLEDLRKSGGKSAVSFARLPADERAAKIGEILNHFEYTTLGREDKGLVRLFLQESTGYSRAQVARYITAHQRAVPVAPVKTILPVRIQAKQVRRLVPVFLLVFLLMLSGAVGRQQSGDLLQVLNAERSDITRADLHAAALHQVGRTIVIRTVGESGSVLADKPLLAVNTRTVAGADGRVAYETLLATTVAQLKERVEMRRQLRLSGLIQSDPSSDVRTAIRPDVLIEKESFPLPPSNQHAAANEPWDIPVYGGTEGQILMIRDGRPVWHDFPYLEQIRSSAPHGTEPTRRAGGARSGGSGGGSTSTTTIIQQVGGTADPSGWTEGSAIVYLTDGADSVGIGTDAPKTKLEVAGTISGSALYIGGTISGASLRIAGDIGAGALNIAGSITGSSLYIAATIEGAGLTSCNSINSKLVWNATTKQFECATDQTVGTGLSQATGDERYVLKQGDTMTGALTIRITGGNNTVGLNVINAISGAVIHAQKSLSTSGSLVFEGAASGSSLYIASSFQGVGLTDCDASTQKLQWDASSGRFSCTADLNTTAWSNTGALRTAFDARYVRTSGGTMTGTLTINLASGYIGLNVINTISGAVIHAQKSLSTSGSLVFEGAASGSSLYIASSLQGAGLVDCDIAGTSKLLWDSATGRFSCGTDTDTNTTYTAARGLTLNGTAFSLNSTITGALIRFTTISGSTIYAKSALNSSGSLSVDGTAYFNASAPLRITDAGFYNCTALETDADGDIVCGSDVDTDTTYQAGQGLTLAGTFFRLNATITGSLVRFTTVSGSSVYAKNSLASSGTLVTESGAYIDGTTLVVQSGNNRVGIGTASPDSALEVLGTISGSALVVNGTSAFNGGVNIAKNNIMEFGFGVSGKESNAGKMGYQAFSMALDIIGAGNQTINNISGRFVRIIDILQVSRVMGTDTLILNRGSAGAGIYIGEEGDSGNLFIRGTGNVAVGTTAPKAKLDVLGTISGSSLLTLSNYRGCTLKTSATGAVICGTDDSTSYYAGQGLTLNGSAFSLSSTITGSLVRFQTVSGSTVYAKNSLVSSGTLVTESGAYFDGTTMVIQAEGNDVGFGTVTPDGLQVNLAATEALRGVDNIRLGVISGTPRLLLEDNGSSTLWEVDNNGGVMRFIGGGVRMAFESSYSWISGDTHIGGTAAPTGRLQVSNGGNSALAVLIAKGSSGQTGNLQEWQNGNGVRLLTVLPNGTLSGSSIIAKNSLSTSGSLTWEGAGSGSSLYIASSIQGVGLTDCDAASQVLKWDDATGRFSCGTATNNSFGSGNVVAIGDSTYVNVGGDTMTGTLIINPVSGVALNARGTISGSSLTISSLQGCDTIDTDAQGNFICGTDQTGGSGAPEVGTASFSGAIIRLGNTQYVRKSGDTMTGTLVINPVSGLALNARGTISGSSLLTLSNYRGCTLKTSATGAVICGTDDGASYYAGQGLTLNGSAFSLNATITGSLVRFTTISGSTIYAKNSLSTSGSLIVESHIYLGTGSSLNWGDGGCTMTRNSGPPDSIVTNSCGITLGGNLVVGTNAIIMNSGRGIFDTSGHGLLVFRSVGGAENYWDLQNNVSGQAVNFVASGSDANVNAIIATKGDGRIDFAVNNGTIARISSAGLSLSGAFVFEGAASGSSLYIASSLDGAGLVDCDLSTQKLQWDEASGRFSCGTDLNTTAWSNTGSLQTAFDARYVNTMGDTMTGSLVINPVSGLALNARGTISGSSLLTLSNYRGCTLKTSATGAVICGTDDGASYYAGQGLSLNGTAFSLNSTITGSLVRFQTVSGSTLYAKNLLASSGTLVTESGAYIDGTTLVVQSGNNRVGIGTASPTSALQVVSPDNGGSTIIGGFYANNLTQGITFTYGGINNPGGAIRMQSSGEPVGIYEGAASAQLHVQSAIASRTALKLTAAANQNASMFEVLNNSLTVMSSIDKSGSGYFAKALGIGTGTPGSKLAVSGAVVIGNNIGSNAAKAQLDVKGTISGSLITQNGAGNNYFMGNVGVGTTSPTTALHILRTTSGVILIENSGNGQAILRGDADRSTAGNSLLNIEGLWNGTAVTRIALKAGNNTTGKDDGSISFSTAETGALLVRMSLTQAGSLGIGTTEPKAKLDVVGTISGSLLSLNGTGTTSIMNYKVGIGTTSPAYKLDINGQMRAKAQFQSYVADGFDSVNGLPGITVTTPTLNSKFMVGYQDAGGGQYHSAIKFLHSSTVDLAMLISQVSGDTQPYFKILDSGKIQWGPGGSTAVDTNLFRSNANVLHTDDDFTASGILLIKPLAKAGSGAATFKPAEFQTGAYISGSGATAIALDTYTNTGSRTPHILFGYRGTFDVGLYRTGKANSGSLALRVANSRSGDAAFEIYSSVTHANNKVFRLTNAGATFADGAYASTGADYAEWFYSKDTLVPGEVVCIDITRNNAVRRCTGNADSNVMGIVSTNPAFIGNFIGGADGIIPPGYALVGLIGQVPAKVIVEGSEGAIRPGDALTSASVAGYARKAKAGESTVGVALEGLTSGKGVVNVLISRRNQSLTVEAVEEKVLKTIASMEIEDEVQLMVSSALGDLNVDEQITNEVTKQIDALTAQSATIESITSELNALKARFEELAKRPTQTGSTTVITQTATTGSTFGHLAASSLELDSTLVTGGDARIGGNLSIDGTLNASSLFVPNGLTIDGGVTMNGVLDAQKLHITEEATVDGMLTINGRLVFGSGAALDFGSGALTLSQLVVENALFVMGDITIKGLATFLGDINVKGELIVSNNQAGFAMIPATGTSVTVRFGSGFKAVPVVTASPDVPVLYAVSKSSATGFTIRLAGPASETITFAWHALSTDDPITAAAPADGTVVFPTDENGVPVSSNMVWNACIRNITMLDDNGQPLSCGRYHDVYTWTHPDLNMSFVWNTSLTPALLQLPAGYEARIMEEAQGIMDAINGEGLEDLEDIEEPINTGSGTFTGTGTVTPVTEHPLVEETPAEEEPIIDEETSVEEPVVIEEEQVIEEEEVIEETVATPAPETGSGVLE